MITDKQERMQLAFVGWLPAEETDLASDSWFTPPELVEEIAEFYGGAIDLDPCASRHAQVNARVEYRASDDGLSKAWHGRVGSIELVDRYVNPPYSAPGPWLRRIVETQVHHGGNTIALLKCDTSTRWWQLCWTADAICWISKRVPFVQPGRATRSAAPFPSALVYWGQHALGFADWFAPLGRVTLLGRTALLEDADRIRADADTLVDTIVTDPSENGGGT